MSEPLSVADVLDRAADLIEPEGAWTQRWTARTVKGELTWATAQDAVCWCMGGAIVRAAGKHRWLSEQAYNQALEVTHGVVTFNDDRKRTQAEVVAKLREAADLARSAEFGNIGADGVQS